MLIPEFTFRGTTAAEKGDKDQVPVRTPDKITPQKRRDLWVWVRTETSQMTHKLQITLLT